MEGGGDGRGGLKGSTGVGAEGTSEAASLTAAQLRPRPSGSSLRRGKKKKNNLQLPLKLSFREFFSFPNPLPPSLHPQK